MVLGKLCGVFCILFQNYSGLPCLSGSDNNTVIMMIIMIVIITRAKVIWY